MIMAMVSPNFLRKRAAPPQPESLDRCQVMEVMRCLLWGVVQFEHGITFMFRFVCTRSQEIDGRVAPSPFKLREVQIHKQACKRNET